MTALALAWRRSEKVEGYESADGVWVIERQEAYTFCENPHPMGKRKPYCWGGEEHEYRLWVLWRDDPARGGDYERMDAGETLAQMKASAAGLAARS